MKEKRFCPISSSFPAILGFWGDFWRLWTKLSQTFSLRRYLLLYSKQPSWSHGFNAKIGLKNEPPWAEIFKKMFFNMAHQTKLPANNSFSQIYQLRLGHFSNRFLRWNRVFKTNVLSTMKGTNGVKKIMKILSMNVKNHLKKNKIAGKLDLIGQKGFSFRYQWPLIEWNQVKYFNLFPSVLSHFICVSISWTRPVILLVSH